MVVSRKIYLFI